MEMSGKHQYARSSRCVLVRFNSFEDRTIEGNARLNLEDTQLSYTKL